MTEAKKGVTVAGEAFEAVEVPHSSKPTAEEQRALDALAEEQEKRDKLAARGEASRFVRLRQGE